MRPIDQTHAPQLTSWIDSANESGSDFPIQNLPYCCFRVGQEPRLGIGIGDQILDLKCCAEADLFDARFVPALRAHSLNEVMSLGVADRIELRARISHLLDRRVDELTSRPDLVQRAVLDQSSVNLLMPATVRDYTDFYASVFHATNVGSMFRPDNPLLPNYKHVPIGYHGRASSLIVSGTDVRRPAGQLSPPEEGGAPQFAACQLLDYELEVGFFVGPGNPLGTPIPISAAEDHLFGMCLVNDWSARDIQKWEYQPLGPFLAKSFATSVSPWVVTLEALAPFRCQAFARPSNDPQPLPYLHSDENQNHGGVDVNLQVSLRTQQMREAGMAPHELSQGNFREMYWTMAQMLAHHSSNGCNLQPGDLLASGTVSNRPRNSRGCLLELTWDGDLDHIVPGTQRTPIELPSGERRKFLEDGDEVIMHGFCERADYRKIGFGICAGTIRAAHSGT